jgi:hypothetical protein
MGLEKFHSRPLMSRKFLFNSTHGFGEVSPKTSDVFDQVVINASDEILIMFLLLEFFF